MYSSLSKNVERLSFQVKRKMLLLLILAVPGLQSFSQNADNSYLRKAEAMYAHVWTHFRVTKYHSMFSENFPSSGKDSLNYFQGNAVVEKEVSFLWPFSGVFSATNSLLAIDSLKAKYLPYLDTCVLTVEQYRDTLRKPAGYQAYPAVFEKVDRYYDDNGLVGSDYLEAYFVTKNNVYLERAKEVFAFIISGWNNDVGGGVTWLEGHNDQKPACSNGTAVLVALKLYQATKDLYYLNWGKKFYDWSYNNLRDTSGLYANDKKMDNSLNRTFYTYNSGFMLEAGVLLYQFTNDLKYLQQAQKLAQAAYHHFTTGPHDKRLIFSIDLPWFVTVLFRGYEALYRIDNNYQYLAAIEKDLNYAWDHARDSQGFITKNWLPESGTKDSRKWLLDEACIAELFTRLAILHNR